MATTSKNNAAVKAAAEKAADEKAADEKAAAEKAAAENAAGDGKVPALRITSSREGFRRAGFVFGKETVTILLADLSKERIKLLKDEPLLTIVETEIEAAE